MSESFIATNDLRRLSVLTCSSRATAVERCCVKLLNTVETGQKQIESTCKAASGRKSEKLPQPPLATALNIQLIHLVPVSLWKVPGVFHHVINRRLGLKCGDD